MSAYAWVVTYDHLDKCRENVIGPRDATPGQVVELHSAAQSLAAREGVTRFRMYDDDGELYYSGLFLGDPDDETAFGPLNDYGTPNAGCTEIRYERSPGKFVTL